MVDEIGGMFRTVTAAGCACLHARRWRCVFYEFGCFIDNSAECASILPRILVAGWKYIAELYSRPLLVHWLYAITKMVLSIQLSTLNTALLLLAGNLDDDQALIDVCSSLFGFVNKLTSSSLQNLSRQTKKYGVFPFESLPSSRHSQGRHDDNGERCRHLVHMLSDMWISLIDWRRFLPDARSLDENIWWNCIFTSNTLVSHQGVHDNESGAAILSPSTACSLSLLTPLCL